MQAFTMAVYCGDTLPAVNSTVGLPHPHPYLSYLPPSLPHLSYLPPSPPLHVLSSPIPIPTCHIFPHPHPTCHIFPLPHPYLSYLPPSQTLSVISSPISTPTCPIFPHLHPYLSYLPPSPPLPVISSPIPTPTCHIFPHTPSLTPLFPNLFLSSPPTPIPLLLISYYIPIFPTSPSIPLSPPALYPAHSVTSSLHHHYIIITTNRSYDPPIKVDRWISTNKNGFRCTMSLSVTRYTYTYRTIAHLVSSIL